MPTLARHDDIHLQRLRRQGQRQGDMELEARLCYTESVCFKNNVIHNKQILLITNSLCSALKALSHHALPLGREENSASRSVFCRYLSRHKNTEKDE